MVAMTIYAIMFVMILHIRTSVVNLVVDLSLHSQLFTLGSKKVLEWFAAIHKCCRFANSSQALLALA